MGFRTILLLVCLICPATAAWSQDASSSSPKERVRAAKALGEQGSAAIPALRKLLKDPEVKVRREAVKSIVKIGTQHSLDALVEATRDADPEVQVWATDGLVNFYVPGYVKTGLTAPLKRAGRHLKSYFTDVNDQVIPPDMEVRPDIIEALGKLARGGTSMVARAHAARALGVLRGRAAVPDLLEAVRSKDSGLIYEALIALQKIGDRNAGPGIAFLLRDLDDRVQMAAIETTGLLQNKDALPQLYEVLNSARNKKIRRAALTAIAMLPDERSRGYYTQYIQDKDPLTRAAAAEGFGRLGNPEDLKMMEGLFQAEKKMNPRLSMAFALVLLGRTELSEFSPLQYLVNTLNSSSYQGVAEPFLIELARQPEVRKNLYQALARGTRDEKIHLARVLAVSGADDSIAALEALTRDQDAEVATEGSRALRILRARLESAS